MENTDQSTAQLREIAHGTNRSAKPIDLRLARVLRRITALPRTPNRDEPLRTPSLEGLLTNLLIGREQALAEVTIEVLALLGGEEADILGAEVLEVEGSAAGAGGGPTRG